MTRYIDADEIRWCDHFDSDGNKTKYKVAYSDEMPPTIEAVPKEKILLLLNIAKEELSKAHANKSANGIVTWSASVTTLEGLLKEYDTADTDIVPVIRCKDCKYGERWAPDKCYCNGFLNVWVDEDDFCAWAEPKDTTEEVRKQLKDMEQRREMDRKK